MCCLFRNRLRSTSWKSAHPRGASEHSILIVRALAGLDWRRSRPSRDWEPARPMATGDLSEVAPTQLVGRSSRNTMVGSAGRTAR